MTLYEKRVSSFLNYCKYEKNLSDKTIKAYTIDLKQYKAKISNTDYADEIFAKTAIKEYLYHINKLYKPKTIKRKIATLKAFFSFLEFEDHIQQSPFRKIR
ncbi:MAG: site-specific integrase, partial [Bacteroidota bacterium]